MDKRKFIYKLNKILSFYKDFAIVDVSYNDDFIFIKFSITFTDQRLSIERVFTADDFITLSNFNIEYSLNDALRKLWEAAPKLGGKNEL